ncbi:MAG: cobalamin-dependent protein, partial [Planctomycetota bacterium]|nr:cobalamin-dependent protein [Planctomycetota bacterium]
RAINPMELYHNQVTRVQGPFSLRMFHRSWGLMLIQANISAHCTCLDFPVLERFIQELRDNRYDVIGITAIQPNIAKVREMCRLIRQHQPQATIVIGGHISGSPDLGDTVDADYVVRGEGIRWFRRFLGENEDQPIRHPEIWSGFGQRAMGFNVPFSPRDVAATLIPSVGCPMGCNFCSTSAMFGGKGKFVSFYETGDELFDIMCQLEASMKTRSFFIMDENFLLHRKRALRLLELMRLHGKGWANYVFSSANALRSYTMEQLVGLGISWVWMGLEGKNSQYGKLDDADTHALVKQLQSHGVRVLGSTIIGLEEHTYENIDEAIDHAVSHDTEFHQFMLYTPVPGTPLHAELTAAGVMIPTDELADADVHGQYRFNYRHPSIRPGDETELLLRAFHRDFDVNGPSILRIVRTTLAGWRRYHNDPEARLRDRFGWEAKSLSTTMAGALWAAARWFKDNPGVRARVLALLGEIQSEFGLKARFSAQVIGRILLRQLRREAKRLANGWTYEPPTFYERNYVEPQPVKGSPIAKLAASVASRPQPVVV